MSFTAGVGSSAITFGSVLPRTKRDSVICASPIIALATVLRFDRSYESCALGVGIKGVCPELPDVAVDGDVGPPPLEDALARGVPLDEGDRLVPEVLLDGKV